MRYAQHKCIAALIENKSLDKKSVLNDMGTRHGCTRTVLLVGTWAIKAPSCRMGLTEFLMGWCGNREEAHKWAHRGMWPQQDLMCPVLHCWLLGLVLVMRRAEEVEYEELNNTELEPLRIITADLHSGNVGRLDGRLVVLDYA